MASEPNCVFCKIVAGQIPANVVYADGDALAFLDVNPLADGHTLLIPKEHHATLDVTPMDVLTRTLHALPKVAAAVAAVTGAEGFNILQNNGRAAGQVVDHIHFHIIPRTASDGLGFRWNVKSTPADAKSLCRKIQERIAADSS